MATLKDIRTRIGSVKNTRKITKAMELVATARLRKAQQQALDLRPYAEQTMDVLSIVAARASEDDPDTKHALLDVREPDHALIVVMTSDRGLAGAFNAAICKSAHAKWKELEEQGVKVAFMVIGRRGRDYFRRRDADIRHDFTEIFSNLTLEKAGEIGRAIVREYIESNEELDLVYMAYTLFRSRLTQEPRMEQLLPIVPKELGEDEVGDYEYEPNKKALLDTLLPMFIEVEVFRALLESVASEHAARSNAMKAATDNASDMIDKLTLQYNRARQAAITTELMEIIGGAEALKG
ncbi:MAG: ATP synthase F1 subunit gamma [Polyangiales bacterium]